MANKALSWMDKWSAYEIVAQVLEIAHDRNPYAARFPEPEMVQSVDDMLTALYAGDFSDYIPQLEEIKAEALEDGDDDELMRVSACLEDIADYLERFAAQDPGTEAASHEEA